MMKKMVVPFEVKQIQEDDDFFIFEGYLSTFGNVDLGDDVVMPGAFKDTIAELEAKGGHLPVLWQHNHDQPVGIFTEIKEDEKGLFVVGKMPKDDTFVSGRVMPQMKVGSINKMSIGYSWWDGASFDVVDGVRQLHKIRLWEGSLVTVPMNPEAEVTGMKSVVIFQDLPLAERDRSWDSDSAIGRVREFVGAEDDGLEDPAVQKRYREAFLFYDREEPENFGAYKLPIADVIDGKLTAVPRGIFAVAGVLRGARGGVFLPTQDRPSIIRNVEKYYEKMGLDSPFTEKSSFRLDDFTVLDEKTLESLLKSGICFSGKNAKAIISAIKSAGLRDVNQEDHRDGDDGLKGICESLQKTLSKINQED